MPKLFAMVTTLTLVLTATGTAAAQSRAYDDRVETRDSVSRRLIHERERSRALERRARMQSLQWRGIDPSRPLDRGGFGTFNVYRYEQQAPWYGPLLPVWSGHDTTIVIDP